MMARSHTLIGSGSTLLIMSSGLIPCNGFVSIDILVGASILGSLLPDIDTPYSKLGRKLPNISARIYKKYGHRTLTHGVFGILGAAGAASIMEYIFEWSGIAFLIGYIMHVVADLFTNNGCALIYPIKKTRYAMWPSVNTNGSGEAVLVLLTLLGMIIMAITVNPHLIQAKYISRFLGHQLF